MTTRESSTIGLQLDRFPEEIRKQVMDATLSLMGVYRDEGYETTPRSAREPKRRPFKRRATHPRKCEVISLADRRAQIDRSAS